MTKENKKLTANNHSPACDSVASQIVIKTQNLKFTIKDIYSDGEIVLKDRSREKIQNVESIEYKRNDEEDIYSISCFKLDENGKFTNNVELRMEGLQVFLKYLFEKVPQAKVNFTFTPENIIIDKSSKKVLEDIGCKFDKNSNNNCLIAGDFKSQEITTLQELNDDHGSEVGDGKSEVDDDEFRTPFEIDEHEKTLNCFEKFLALFIKLFCKAYIKKQANELIKIQTDSKFEDAINNLQCWNVTKKIIISEAISIHKAQENQKEN